MVIVVRTRAPEHLNGADRAWVTEYRGRYAVAEHWATGCGHVFHSTETQQRVFRLTEQLARRGIERAVVFRALEAADRSVALASDPQAAAEAGHRAITQLVRLSEKSVLICADELNLQPFGFDPISFDGRDPAAYAWVMFELSTRADAEYEALPERGERHRTLPTAIGLARL